MTNQANQPADFGSQQFRKLQFGHKAHDVTKSAEAEKAIRSRIQRPAKFLLVVSVISLAVTSIATVAEVLYLTANRDTIVGSWNGQSRQRIVGENTQTGRRRGVLSNDQEAELARSQDWNSNLFTIQLGFVVCAGFAIICLAVFFVVSAVKMRRLVGYKQSVAASVLAMVPICSPLIIFGIPFGIWCLIALRDKDVKRAFKY